MTTAYGVLSFILLARKWPKLMQHWEFVEAILPPYRSAEQKKQLSRKIKTVSCIVLSVALGISFLTPKKNTKYFNYFIFILSSGTHSKYGVYNNGCNEFDTQKGPTACSI